MTAIAVTIAGSDSGGGAGIQADLKTFSALGVYGASVITALTAQNTQGVRAIHDVPAAFVEAQITAVFEDLDVNAIKIGMLSKPEVIRAVSDLLDVYSDLPIVLDPVMVATSGDLLLAQAAVSDLKSTLLCQADLITPNLAEAAFLTGLDVATTQEAMVEQAETLLCQGARAVLLKGGHGQGNEAADFFCDGHVSQWFSAPRVATKNTHGTGCTLSSAIAAGLAKKRDLNVAISEAKAFVTGAIAAADELDIGKGHGPTHHFHALWS